MASMAKRLISCTSCKLQHPPRGGMFCVYAREAKTLCATLGVSEEDFLLHLDLEKARADSEAYLKDNEGEVPVPITSELIQQLVADNIAQRDAITRQDKKLDSILSTFQNLSLTKEKVISKPTHELSESSDILAMLSELLSPKSNPTELDGASKQEEVPNSDLMAKLSELLSATVPSATKTVPIFSKVTQIAHDPVLQKHTAQTHFTPLVHGHRPRAADRDIGRHDDYYSDRSPSRASDRRKRRLLYFDLEPHMAFDSRTTDYRTFEDVLSANLSLVDSLSTQGYSVSCYLKHIRFLVDKSKVYTAASLVRYDQAVRERADVLGENTMMYGDHELVHRFLGPENIKPKQKSGTFEQKDSSNKGGKRKQLPVGLCWKWNFGRKCQGPACALKHLCTECYGNHRASECPKSETRALPSGTPPLPR